MIRQGAQPVPGCSPKIPAQNDQNFCYEAGPGILVHAANNGEIGNFGLQECQGDCDTDADCAHGLVCFERSANEEVPGDCEFGGTGIAMEDYCIKPYLGDNQLLIYGLHGEPAENYPLQECQGDCDTDDDCEVSSIIDQRHCFCA